MRRRVKAENRDGVVTEAGSYLRRIDFCITQLKAQGLSRTCNESKEINVGWTGDRHEARRRVQGLLEIKDTLRPRVLR